MSDFRIHLLCTGGLSSELIDEASSKGILIDAYSFIETEPVSQPRLRELLKRQLIAVFTSKNAVKAMGNEGGRDWKIFCIGETAVQRFGEGAIIGKAQSARELAEEIIRTQEGREIYFFCGDRRRDELPSLLRKEGFTIHEVTVYRTIATPHKLTGDYDGVAFFSPSAVDSFFSANGVASGTPLFAIGETTAESIRMRCVNPVIVCQRPGKDHLIRSMIDYFSI